MLPISEFHFAFCGIATVAATLGYACARRAARSLASPNDEPSKADVETGPPEERSLKRKLDDSDEHDADAEEQSRPVKRNRTPPTDQHELDEDFTQEWEVVVAPPPYEQAVGIHQPEVSVQDNSTPLKQDSHSVEREISPVPEPTSAARPETLSHSEQKGAEAGSRSTPQPSQVNLSPNDPKTPPTRPITPPKPAAPSKIESVKAFSTFSGSSSPFASYSNASGASPFAISGQVVKTTPTWRHGSDSEPDVFGRTSSMNALAPSPNDAILSPTTKSSALLQNKRSPEVPEEPQSLVKSSNYVTGEEDEDVEAELKGVKLFIKRGHKEFTDGMYGHIKILAQKSTPPNKGDGEPQETETETNSRTRLLFRRDPLGQVSMNVGLRPTARCHLDTAENILRIITVEPIPTDGKDAKENVVVYALKPGRAQKADFSSFAKTLCDHDGFKPKVVTRLADYTCDAAAS